MGGHVIKNRDEDVLKACKIYKQDIWWLIVYLNKNKLEYAYFLSSSSQQFPRLLQFVKELKNRKTDFLVFAIWHGKRRTDAFLINPDKLLEVI